MEFNVITECTCCGQTAKCNEDVCETENKEQFIVNFCEDCYKKIERIRKIKSDKLHSLSKYNKAMVQELKEPSRQQEVFETAMKINEMEEKNNA